MDKISDFFDSALSRLTSPFIVSFVISWCLWNWKVPIGLIWYNAVQLEEHGWLSVWWFINAHTDWWKSIVLPGLSALAYPWIKYLVMWYNSWVTRIGEKQNFQISGDTHISVKVFEDARLKFDEEKKAFQTTINSIEATKKENKTLEDEIQQLQTALSNVEESNRKNVDMAETYKKMLHKINNVGMMDGQWDFKKNLEHYRFTIRKGNITAENLDKPHDRHGFSIRNFHYNALNNSVFFIRKGGTHNNTGQLINELKFNSETVLSGLEGVDSVVYTKIAP